MLDRAISWLEVLQWTMVVVVEEEERGLGFGWQSVLLMSAKSDPKSRQRSENAHR